MFPTTKPVLPERWITPSGIAINIMVMKYFKENPDCQPKTAGLLTSASLQRKWPKGSFAFVKAYKDARRPQRFLLINVDSIADADHFEVIKGDTLAGTKPDLLPLISSGSNL